MYLYINGFRCASSDSKEEVAIQFTLDGPLFKEDGSCSTTREEVTSIVMSSEVAKKLATTLLELGDNKSNE